ncbi:MAG: hypothetical protein P8J87_20020 [Verrucomicrobiales bacterium]|nr:hypothetical protein [Verrucomicrobiales bacterium]
MNMTKDEAIDQIQTAANQISLLMMKVQPAVPALEDEAIQGLILKASYDLTVQLEIIKKQVIVAKGRDGSTEL